MSKSYCFLSLSMVSKKRKSIIIAASLILICLGLDLSLGLAPKFPNLHPKIENTLLSASGDLVVLILEGEGGCVCRIDQEKLLVLGVTVEAQSKSLMRVRAPKEKLLALAEVEGVTFIRSPYTTVPLVKVSEGVGPTGAILFHSFGFRGQKIKVAVIDVGFGDLSRAIERGELSWDVIAWTKDYTGEGLEVGTSHGTAVAEVVHDMAPQAKLYLMKIGDEVDLENAVWDAIRLGVHIINHSVGWVNTNFNDGTGIVSSLADLAHLRGILWVNAVGNHAKMHWEGDFIDSDGDGWIEFKGEDESLGIQAWWGQIQAFLTWDNWPHSDQDFDLFLFDAVGNVVASSQNWQTGQQPPTEQINHVVIKPGGYHLKVLARNRLRKVRLKIFSLNHPLEHSIPQGSLLAPADSKGAMAVAAIPYIRWETGPQASFSSQGPTSDGRIKPDISGPDSVTNFIYRWFQGTSAAAPHVAGAAALLLSQNPNLTVDQLWDILEGDAVDMGPKGKDILYGAGRLRLFLGKVSATRTISTVVRSQDQDQVLATPGEIITVTVTATMPPTLFGGISLTEEPDFGFIKQWTWPVVHPGQSKTITYQLKVPQTPGVYKIEGKVNDQTVKGHTSIKVIPQLSVFEAIAWWDGEKIDLTLDEVITEGQVQAAVGWWLADREVPGAWKILSLRKMQELVSFYLTKTSISQPLPKRLGDVTARRFLSKTQVKPGESFEVSLEIRVNGTLEGLALTESLPPFWKITPLRSDGAVYKAKTREWLWVEKLPPGEVKTVHYRVEVPWDASPQTSKIFGLVSSYLPMISVRVEGDERISVEGFNLEIYDLIWKGGALTFPSSVKELEIFDLAGRLIFSSKAAGGPIRFYGRDNEGRPLANGVYLYVVTTSDRKIVKKLVILR